MIFLYTLLGVIAAIIGAFPLGASNIAVINTTINYNLKSALKIAFTAGIAEVILSYYALNYNLLVKDFFLSNQWIQVLIALLLLSIGGFFKFYNFRVIEIMFAIYNAVRINIQNPPR